MIIIYGIAAFICALWFGIDTTASGARLINNGWELISKVKYKLEPNVCEAKLIEQFYNGYVWHVAYSPWSLNGCETLLKDEIVVRLDECDIEEMIQIKGITGWCCRVEKRGTWKADMRFQRADMKSNIWDMPCQLY